ncbi:hypothetical protein POM88_018113 [Heracleum sosnowskyi]|uniref:Transposase-associated domain-containing protein n=1 Tax=Heracleum sosnowskyi TaxID=360622 RepID=A0AAD8ITT2_9APIA|nr:hypothetical protein POM88_018113 [Heracleum sosnowskyi]
MDRHTWMYKIPRATADYIKGVEDFITYAMLYLEKKHKEEGKEQMILCPCRDCNNFKKYRSVDTVRDHLFRRGFKEGYEKWIWHGEGLDSTRTSGTKRGREEDSMEKNDEEDMENDRRRILGIENVEDEDEYDQFDENPPFSMGVSTSYENEFVDADYIRNDHDEGVWIDGQVWAAGFAAALLKKRSSATYSSVEAGEDNAAESETNVAKLGPKEPLLVEVVLLLLLEKLFSFLLNTPDLNQYIFSMDGDKSDSNSSRGKKRKPRGPTLCTKLKEKIKNKKTESKIEFDEDGTAVGDMASQFASYIGTEVRLHVNINIKGWNLVNEGLKNMLWEDIKMHWKLEDDQLKKQVMEAAGKSWKDFKGNLAHVEHAPFCSFHPSLVTSIFNISTVFDPLYTRIEKKCYYSYT